MSRETEFELISQFLAPLTNGYEGAFDLRDDAAVIDGGSYVLSKDVLIEGVHFLKSDPASLVSKKALRVNLSDLAAMGAKPLFAMLGISWQKGVKTSYLRDCLSGLREDLSSYKVSLLGGDTTMHRLPTAPLTLSVTIIGEPPKQGVIRRNGAHKGDDVYVTGVVGDAGLGLAALTKREKFSAADRSYFAGKYQCPTPRIAFGGAIAGIATSCIDVSDGLIADARHIGSASGAKLKIWMPKIPASPQAMAWLEKQDDGIERAIELASAGDDYELLFTAPPSRRRAVEMAGQLTRTPVTKIGVVESGEGVCLVDENDAQLPVKGAGYDHFAS